MFLKYLYCRLLCIKMYRGIILFLSLCDGSRATWGMEHSAAYGLQELPINWHFCTFFLPCLYLFLQYLHATFQLVTPSQSPISMMGRQCLSNLVWLCCASLVYLVTCKMWLLSRSCDEWIVQRSGMIWLRVFVNINPMTQQQIVF